jgi:hypothetical protein
MLTAHVNFMPGSIDGHEHQRDAWGCLDTFKGACVASVEVRTLHKASGAGKG